MTTNPTPIPEPTALTSVAVGKRAELEGGDGNE